MTKSKIKLPLRTQEEIEISHLTMELDVLKTEYSDRLLPAIVKYIFPDVVSSGPYFERLFYESLQNCSEVIVKSKIPDSMKDELKSKLFFGNIVSSEQENLKEDIKHYKSLVSFAKNHFDMLSQDKKLKIAKDCIKKQVSWSNNFDITSNIYSEIKNYKKKKKKVKK